MDELNPCPFCGKPPITSPSGEGGKGLMIECLTEGCVNPHTSYYSHAAAILTWNTRAASGGESLVSQPVAPHAANNAISPTVRATAGSVGLNKPFGKPEQFDVNEPSGDSGQLASLEQRARELLTDATYSTPYTGAPYVGVEVALRAITAALANQQGVDGWQPIEMAPRDGTRIILGRPDCDGDGGVSVAGYWLEELEDGVDYMGNDGGFTDVDYQVFQPGRSFGAESYRHSGSQPTHWRPMPEPPTQPAGDVGSQS